MSSFEPPTSPSESSSSSSSFSERGRERVSRRSLLRKAAGLSAVAAMSASGMNAEGAIVQGEANAAGYVAKNGRIRQSVCSWCFKPMSIDELARNAKAMGMQSVELIGPEHWKTLEKHGLACAITGSHGFTRGLNDPENHAYCIDRLTKSINATSDAGFTNVITFSGMRKEGISDDVGIANMVAGIKKVIGLAETKRVNICLEMLNSRVDVSMKGHPGYQCDHLEWAREVCDRVGSERMKILFDIYHVQIMQGDVISRIHEYKDYTAHYHTAGVPGRGEIDAAQELNYPPIMKAIAETGYKGYVGQEFIPVRDPMKSLRESVQICDV